MTKGWVFAVSVGCLSFLLEPSSGELTFSAFFVLTGWALLRSRTTSRWVAAGGLLTGFMGWIGMFRNLTRAVAPVAAVNNYLLPLWMIVLGVILVRYREPEPRRT